MAGPGAMLGLRRGQVEVRVEGRVVDRVPLADVERIIVSETAGAVSVRLLVEAARHGVPIVFVGRDPDATGVVMPGVPSRTVAKTVAQALWRADAAKRLAVAKWFVRGKNDGRIWLLKRLSKTRGEQLREEAYALEAYNARILGAGSIEELRLVEAEAGRRYWAAVRAHGLIPAGEFPGRIPRRRLDPWNNSLDLLYAALRGVAHRALTLAGLNPYLGYMHVERSGRPSLTLDYMECYRWLAEWTLYKATGRGFRPGLEADRLDVGTVRRLLTAWDAMLSSKYPGSRDTVARVVERDAWRLGEALVDGGVWAPQPLGAW